MHITTTRLDDMLVVSPIGLVDSARAGQLYDALVGAVEDGWTKLILDLSSVSGLTHAGARGIIVAAKLLRSRRGALRLCQADRPVETVLRGLGFNHLLRLDPSLEAAIAALSPEPQAPVWRAPRPPFDAVAASQTLHGRSAKRR